MCRVLEDVPRWHRRCRKSVQKKGLKLAFNEMERDQGAGKGLQSRWLGGGKD